jgi:type II secretory pathway pseudopilin PulG
VGNRRQHGFTYLGALFLVVLMGAALAGAGTLWSTVALRAKERELLWVGGQYAHALRRYYENSPGVKQYPMRLEELLKDDRHPTVQRYLRRLYPDPFTGNADWGLILSSDGRIAGVHSESPRTALKSARFPPEWTDFEGKSRYAEWEFVAERAFLTGAPGSTAPSPDGPAAPGTSPLLSAPLGTPAPGGR